MLVFAALFSKWILPRNDDGDIEAISLASKYGALQTMTLMTIAKSIIYGNGKLSDVKILDLTEGKGG